MVLRKPGAMASCRNTFLLWMWRTLILSQFILSAVHSSHLHDPKVCGNPTCLGVDQNKFNFEPKLKYVYSYNMTIHTFFDVAKSNTSRLNISAVFSIEFNTPCEGTLKILEATLDEGSKNNTPAETSAILSDKLSANSLRFYFEDGRMQEVCPHRNDTSWVVNFKKGILSSLQNTMKRMDIDHNTVETDINGKCRTEYKLEELSGTTLIISKKKDIFSCVDRAQLHSFIPTSSYIFQNRNHKWTPLESNNLCQQQIDHRIITMVTCEEHHSFLPLYNQKNGVTTALKFQLELIEETHSTHDEIEENKNQGDVYRRESLLYDHHKTPKAISGELKESKDLITTLCLLNSDEFQPESAQVFNKFIHRARHLPFQTLSQLFNDSVSLCPSGKKHMIDALPHLRSSASISVMSDVIMQNTLPLSVVKEFLLSIALQSRPEESTITAVTPLLLKPIKGIELNTMLTVSSLIHSFCESSSGCEKNEDILHIIVYFDNIIANSCQSEDLQKIMFALKAIGNAGVLTSEIISNLQGCIKNPGLPLDIRVAAVEAYRRHPCDTDKDFLLNIFVNQTFGTGLRIAAYLQIMKCPSYYVMKGVRQALEKEEFNQVGSFVWSHLQNQKKSSMPSRVEIQAMLQDQELKTKFNNDFRKFSRNYEQSFFLNEYGIGGFVVYSIIFAHNSYVPSTITANITINIFGETVNIAEATLNLQGFEYYIETLFWHEGIFSKTKMEPLLRLLRSLPLNIKDQVDQIPNFIREGFEYPKASLSLKLFGNEVKYFVISGKDDVTEAAESLNPLTIIKHFLSGQQLDVEKSLMFVDVRYIAPLSVGMPLAMDAVGTATIKLNMAGFFNSTAFTADGQLDIDGKLKPSIAVNTVGTMGVDAFFGETGVKLHNKVFTSTAMEGRLKMKGYKFVSLALNLPLKKSEIFSMENQLLVLNGKEEITLDGITPGRVKDQICSWSLLDDVLGLQLCTSYLLPNSSTLLKSPLLIFTSPVNIRIFLEKSDPSTKKYTFEYKMVQLENKTLLSVEFETPDSNIKRSLKATVLLDVSSQNYSLVFQSASNQIKAEGFYVNVPEEMSLNFLLDINGKKHVDIQLALYTKQGKHSYTYEPKLLFQINNKRVADLSGSYKWVEKNSISQCEINLNFSTNRFFTNIKGYVRTNDASVAMNINMEYTFDNGESDYLKFELELSDRSKKQLDKYNGNFLILSSAYPQINLVTEFHFQRTEGSLDCKIMLGSNPEINDENKKLNIKLDLYYHKTLVGSKTNVIFEINKPDNLVDIKFALSHQVAQSVSESVAIIRYAMDKEIKIKLNISNPKGSLIYLETKLQVELPADLKPLTLLAHIHEKKAGEFDIDFMGTWFSGHTLSIKGMYQDRSTNVATIHNIKLVAKSPVFYDIALSGRLLVSDEEYKMDVQAEHNSVNYVITLSHVTSPGVYLQTYIDVEYGHSSYVISNFIDLVNKHIRIELQLDQYREIHISLRGIHNNTVTNAGFDISWDVNRDPTQRIVLTLESLIKGYLNYEGKFIIEYPGRVITALVEFSHRDTDFMGTARLDWSQKEKINIILFATYDLMKNGIVSFRSKITSPFENWQSTSLNYGLLILENSTQSNASISWQELQSVHFDVSCIYLISDALLDLNFKTILNSTIPEISSMHIIFHHVLSDSHFDSGVIIQSAPGHVASLQSVGHALRDKDSVQYSGYVDVTVPFNNWTGGHLSCNTSLDKHRSFLADLKLILNDRQFSSSIKGTMKTLNESRVIILFTTPYEKYKKIIGRFIYSTSRKHFVFDIKGPAPLELGFEVKYVYYNFSNFDLALHAMTGVSFVNNILIVGQRNDKLVDFRTGWNAVMVGVTGKSVYESWDNFEYKGLLYTPFEGFKESGITVKFVYTDNIDFEARAGVAQYKVGFKFQARDWKKIDSAFVLPQNKSFILPSEAYENENTSYNLRGLFELDSLIYPTISGNVDVIRQKKIYYLTGNLVIPYLAINVEDELNLSDIVQLSNHFSLRTNNSVLAELESSLAISGLHTSTLLIKLDAVAFSNNQSLDFDMETAYIFKQTGQDFGPEGIYKVNHKLRTPFDFLDHFYLDFNLQNQNHAYGTNLTLDIRDVRVVVDGSLDMSIDGNYLATHTEMSIFSPVFMLPVLKLSLTKDFNEVENKLMALVQYSIGTEIEKSPIIQYGVGGTWHFGGNELFKLSGYILTPHSKLDELRASVYYSHDVQDQLYFVDTFFKYSSDIEIKLRGNVDKSDLVLHIETSNENFRIVDVNGTVKQNEEGYFTIESVVSSDSVITMQGKMTSSYEVPVFLDLKLYHRNTRQPLVGVKMDVRMIENSKGYNMLLLVQFDSLNINLEGDLSNTSAENIFNVIVMTNHHDYKKLNLTLQLPSARNLSNISRMQLSGSTDLKLLVSEFIIICSHWSKGNEGYFEANLESTQLRGRSYLAWTLDYLKRMQGFANATYSYENTKTDFSSQLFLISPNKSLDNIFIGADFNTLNKNWWFNTNVSLMAPTLNNIAFTSHLRLPHNVHEVHTMVGKLHYTKDMMYVNQLLKYSTVISDTGFETLTKMNRTENSLDSEIFLRKGIGSTFFLHDTLTAKKITPSFELINIFKSSLIKEDLSLKLLYDKPSTKHIIKVDMFYPSSVSVVGASVDYASINNLYAIFNCTAPFSGEPSIAAQIKAVTNQGQYQRHCKMDWQNNTALFNYTHTRTEAYNENKSIISDGIFIVDFPLATRHVGQVTYTYEELEKWFSGYSKMVYNEEEILRGNFTYHFDTSTLSKKEDISVNVDNSFVPLGLKYFSESNKGIAHKEMPLNDRKRAELFNLKNSTTFNVTGELIINKALTEDAIMLKVIHANANRSLTIETINSINNTFKSSTNLYLKPNMWFKSILSILTRDNATAYGKKTDLFLSYPNREFFIHGNYIWGNDQFISEISVCPNKLIADNSMVGAAVNWRKSQEDLERQHTSLVISHPSFEKNLTFIGEIKLKEWALLNLNSSFEYVKDRKRKMSFSGLFENKKAKLGREYSVNLFANHPSSRLNLDFISYLKIGQAVFDFKKNITYTRSYLPLQFWISRMKLDSLEKVFELESRSLRELILVHADYTKEGPLYKINGSAVKGTEDNVTGQLYINLDNADSRLIVNFTPDASKQLQMRARYVDNRHAFFNIWRVYEEVFVPDFTFDAKLNHSRLLFGTLSWRPQIKNEIAETFQSSSRFVWTYIIDAAEFWTEYVKSETIESIKDVWNDAKPVMEDFLDDIKNVDMLKEDIEYFRAIFNESYDANEFYMQDIYNIYLLLAEEIAFKDKMGSLPKIVNELWNIMGETGETIRQSIVWVTETLKRAYTRFLDFFSKFLSGETTQQLSQTVSNIFEKYDKLIKDLHVSFIHYIESLWDQTAGLLANYWAKCLHVIEPVFIQIVHHIETAFWTGSKQIIAFMYQKQNQFLNSPYFSKESKISQEMDKFYKDLTKQDFFSNLSKYASIFLGVVKEKYFAVVPFGYELNAIASDIYNEIKVLYNLPAVSFTLEASYKIYLKVIWVFEYFQIGNKIQKAIPVVYHQLSKLSHNALENEMKNRDPKTKFIFDPERGYIHLEQKLPVPWHSFNETPSFAEIPEYKMLSDIQSWFSPSNTSFMNLYYRYCPLLESSNWLPPFQGQAIIIKNKHFITFDGKFFSYTGPCSYLLAKDFINNDFALVLKSDSETVNHHSIAVLIKDNIIEIDLIRNMIKLQDNMMNLPANLNGTHVFIENNIVTVTSQDQFVLKCNLKYDVCTFDLYGWYFGKTAGLLGTMDNEPSNDILSSRGYMEPDRNKFIASWTLESLSCPGSAYDSQDKSDVNVTGIEECNSLFASKTSQFSTCFHVVDPLPFNSFCQVSFHDHNDDEFCTSAVSYAQACLKQSIPLRIPYSCVKCHFENGTQIPEGDFVEINSKSEPHSADIVFVVEAKECNTQPSMKKHIPIFLSMLTKELQGVDVNNNRFSVVTFGGDGVFNKPNSIFHSNRVFSNSEEILDVFTNIPTGNGDSDIFGALKYATKMQFRVGVSKIFILIPCTSCDISNMTMDYTVLSDVLRERGITLHILMNNDFGLRKSRTNKKLYGLDSQAAYTKNDFRSFKGDRDLLRQVKITKSLLGYCTPLALDTNGTLFSAKKLDNKNVNAAKKFLSVFAKRIAKTAAPPSCQMCECSADDNGIDFSECFPCDTPLPSIIDFSVNSTYTLLQSFEESDSEMDSL